MEEVAVAILSHFLGGNEQNFNNVHAHAQLNRNKGANTRRILSQWNEEKGTRADQSYWVKNLETDDIYINMSRLLGEEWGFRTCGIMYPKCDNLNAQSHRTKSQNNNLLSSTQKAILDFYKAVNCSWTKSSLRRTHMGYGALLRQNVTASAGIRQLSVTKRG
jgi:hypothetical protein